VQVLIEVVGAIVVSAALLTSVIALTSLVPRPQRIRAPLNRRRS
jgi:hypothetical protein